MPSEPQQGRRGHFRGRRGGDRHGSDRARGSRPAQRDKGSRPANTLDVDQIVGELRARIATQKGVELSNTQIEELAARRLEAILAPRAADAALLDALRQSAGSTGTAVPRPEPLPTYAFGDDILYDSGNGFVRLVRRLLRPFLRLLFDPDPLVSGLGTQTRINAELAAREQRGSARQAEWNALHFELVKRVVTENARASLDVQNLAAQIEALSAKIDFNERRVRGIEGTVHQARPPRQSPAQGAGPAPEADGGSEGTEAGRRRRRRRPRRNSGADMAEGPSPRETETLPEPISQPVEAIAAPEPDRAPAAAIPAEPAPTGEPLREPADAKADSGTVLEPASDEARAVPSSKDVGPWPGEPERPAPQPGGDTGRSTWRQVFSPPPPDEDMSDS